MITYYKLNISQSYQLLALGLLNLIHKFLSVTLKAKKHEKGLIHGNSGRDPTSITNFTIK